MKEYQRFLTPGCARAIAIARTKDGVRVMGWLEDVKLEDVKVGMKLKMSTKKLPDGFLVITFKPSSSR